MKTWRISYTIDVPNDLVEAHRVAMDERWVKLFDGGSDVVWAAPRKFVLSVLVLEAPAV